MIFIIFALCIFNTLCPMCLVEEYIEFYTGVQKKDIPTHLQVTQPIAKSANGEFLLYSEKSPCQEKGKKEDIYVYQLFHKSSNTTIDYWHDSSEWKHALINNSGTQVITKRTRFQYNNTNDVKTGDNSDFWMRTITYENNQKKSKSRITELQRKLDLKYFFNENVVIALEDTGAKLNMVAWDIANKFSRQDVLPHVAINTFDFDPIISSKSFDSERIFIADIDCKEKPQKLMVHLWNIKTGKSETPELFTVKELLPPFILAVSATKRYFAVSSGKSLIAFDTHNNTTKSKTLPQRANHIYFDNSIDGKVFCTLTDAKQWYFLLSSQTTQ